jgi:hypothetical protein
MMLPPTSWSGPDEETPLGQTWVRITAVGTSWGSSHEDITVSIPGASVGDIKLVTPHCEITVDALVPTSWLPHACLEEVLFTVSGQTARAAADAAFEVKDA